MKNTFFTVIFTFFLVFMQISAHAHSKHEHDLANMNIVVEGETLTIELDSPLANFLGFEHAPKNEKQKTAVRAMASALRTPQKAFAPTQAAACKLTSVKLESPKLDPALLQPSPSSRSSSPIPTTTAAQNDSDDHGDLEAVFTFTCEHPEKLNNLKVTLFSSFPNLKKIETQIVTSERQTSVVATPQKPQVTW